MNWVLNNINIVELDSGGSKRIQILVESQIGNKICLF
jgi:hypothetical protein